MATKVTINGARGTFLHLYEKQKALDEDGHDKYSGNFIIPTDHPAVPLIKAAMIEAATGKWGENGVKVMAAFESRQKCLRNGDLCVDKQGNTRNGFAGNFYVVASNQNLVGLYSNLKDPGTGKARALTVDDDTLYDGCYVNVLIDVYAIDRPKVKGVFAELRGVQFAGDGDRLGGSAPASADEFDAAEPQADMSDLF